MEKICIFGGSFDPVHVGHEYAAKQLSLSVDPDVFYIVPCFLSPFKNEKNVTDANRMDMAKIAFGGIKNVAVSDYEIEKAGVSYTYATVEHYRKMHPGAEIYLLMGSDPLASLDRWKRFEYLVSECVFAVVSRATDENAKAAATALRLKYGARFLMIDVPGIDVSSSEIRRSLAKGIVPDGALNENVKKYIIERGLYFHPCKEVKKMYDLEKIKSSLKMSEYRFRHTLGTEKAALELAKRHYPSLDPNAVAAAALLHDSTKELTPEEHIAILDKYGLSMPEGKEAAKKFFHAKTGAAIAEHEYGLSKDAASAIAYHTTGRKNMTPFEKVIYFADYIEENRDDDVCVGVRNKYHSLCEKYSPGISLDMALLYALDKTIKLLVKERRFIHPDTVDARNDLILSLGEYKDAVYLKQTDEA